MKNLIPTIAIIGLILVSSCSEIAENNDPIIGIWSNSEKFQTTAKSENIRNEWIFNDVYLGRYHQYNDGDMVILSDFSWSLVNDVYTITYPGLETRPADTVTLSGEQLVYVDGQILAARE